MTAFRVLDPGPFTTLQDAGRFGHQRHGVPVSGALDREAMRLANALAGNPDGTAVLELRFAGPTLEVEAESARIAIAGATVAGTLVRAGETHAVGAWRTVTLKRGDRLRVGPLGGSTTACLAVSGGFQVAPVLGSRATLSRGGIGGFGGRRIAAGDRLPLCQAKAPPAHERALPAPPDLSTPDRIRVVLGPQADHFTAAAIETFLTAAWTVTRHADRMGLRLDGPKLEHRDVFDITSDGIVTGAIQVPGTARPIVLLSDRQTSGGYPKIATAITADLSALGRLGAGARLRFEAVTAAEGARIARAREREIAAMIAAIGPHRAPGAIEADALYNENLISPPIGME